GPAPPTQPGCRCPGAADRRPWPAPRWGSSARCVLVRLPRRDPSLHPPLWNTGHVTHLFEERVLTNDLRPACGCLVRRREPAFSEPAGRLGRIPPDRCSSAPPVSLLRPTRSL